MLPVICKTTCSLHLASTPDYSAETSSGCLREDRISFIPRPTHSPWANKGVCPWSNLSGTRISKGQPPSAVPCWPRQVLVGGTAASGSLLTVEPLGRPELLQWDIVVYLFSSKDFVLRLIVFPLILSLHWNFLWTFYLEPYTFKKASYCIEYIYTGVYGWKYITKTYAKQH